MEFRISPPNFLEVDNCWRYVKKAFVNEAVEAEGRNGRGGARFMSEGGR